MHGESTWKLLLGVVVLLFFLVIGVAHIANPDYFLRRSAVRKGGELLSEWNRMGFQIVGLLLVCFSGFVLYELGKDFLVLLKTR